MHNSAFMPTLLLATIGLLPVAASAEDAASQSGAELFKFYGCINCHGVGGKAPVSKLVPELGGKPADELYHNATEILGGTAGTEESKLMHAAIHSPANCNAPPSAGEIKTITSWLSTQ